MNGLLADDHSELDAILQDVFTATEKADAEEIYQKLDYFWARLAMHIRAEHLHLFPAIIGTLSSCELSLSEKTKQKLETLQDDHNFFMREILFLIKLLREMQKTPKTDPTNRFSIVFDKLNAVRERLESHNHLEETEIYQVIEITLDSAELSALNKKMQREIENLPPRFAKT